MRTSLDLFHANVSRSRDLANIARAMSAQTTAVLDTTDILRASLMMAVSSLDYFIHAIVRIGMLEAYRAERIRTPAFLRFQVTLNGILQASSGADSEGWLDQQIRARHGHQSFQMPESIAEAVRLVSDAPLWDEVAQRQERDAREVTDRLKLIVQRRNKIAHEADIMPDYAGQIIHSALRSPIDPSMVDDAIDFIEQVAEAIYALVSPRPPAIPAKPSRPELGTLGNVVST